MSSSQRKKCGVLQLGNKKFFTYEGLNLVGRNRDAAAILKDPIASIHHAIVTVVNECHYISDVKSTNGTKLDGNKLVPLHMYALEEGSRLEFTPNLSGTYKIIPANPSQTLLLTQIESQTTQTPEGLFGANTQLEPTTVFGDDDSMDHEMSKIVVNTQFINDSVCQNIKNDAEPKESVSEDKEDIHEMETQRLVSLSVPSINDAQTQVIENQTSMLSAFTDTQCFNENNDNAVVSNEQEKEHENVLIHAEDPMIGKVSNELSSETSKALNVPEDAPTNDKNELHEEKELETNKNQESNVDSGSETDVDEEYIAEIASRPKHDSVSNFSTLTVGSEAESQAKIKSQGSVCSLNLQYSLTQPNNDPDNNSNSSDCFLTAGTDMSLNSALKLVKDSQVELEEKNAQEQKAEETGESAETREKGRLSQSNKQSEDIISDSEDDAFSFSKGLKPMLNSTSNTSNVRRSRFILSDSEEEDVEGQKKNDPKQTHDQSNIPNDTISEYDDSYVQRKSVGNATSECIPGTQDFSFQPAENESFKIGLSRVLEVSELDITALKGDVSKKIGIEESMVENSSINEGLVDGEVLEESVDKSSRNDNNDDTIIVNLDLFAPTQPLCLDVNPSNLINDTQDCDFEAATQQLPLDAVEQNVNEGKIDDKDEDVDFFAPTQDLLHDAKEVDEDGFCMPTQPVREFCKSKKESLRKSTGKQNETQSEDFDFDAATQQIQPDVPDDILEADTQKIDAPDASSDHLEDDDDLFSAPTQAMVKEKSKEPKRVSFQVPQAKEDDETRPEADKDSIDFEEATQPVIVQPPKIPNVESQLEVMFESQNVSLSASDPSRPSNPLANMLETCSTQDVIASLTGTGTKRLSSEREDNNKAKRAKTTPNVKSTRESETKTPTQRVSRSSASKTPKIEVNNNPAGSASKNKSILDYMEKVSPVNRPNGDIFISSKLSLLRREANVRKEPESDSDDDIECLADTIPIHSHKTDKSGETEPATITPAKKIRRKILSEEDLAVTPQPVVKLIRISEAEVQNGKLSPREEEKPVENAKRTKTNNKKEEKVKRSRGRPKKTEEASKSTHNDESVDSTQEKDAKGRVRKTRAKIESDPEDSERPSSRTSKRSKRAVNYCENSQGSNSSVPEKKSTQDEAKLASVEVEESKPRLTRGKKSEKKIDVELINTDERGKETKEKKGVETPISQDVEAASTSKRAGRSTKARTPVEPTSQSSTPDRAKRIAKPKVIFTMLDDPQLKQLIRSLGGSVVEKIETATVLVTTKIQRTLKLLTAIANSVPICSPDWLRACKKANEFLDPWDYLITDAEAERQWNFQLSASLQCSKEGKIFSGCTFLLLITLSADVIKGAIIANGGKAVLRKPSSGEFTVVAAPSQKSKYEAYLKNGTLVISSEAILVSILRQKLDFEEFELK